ncbi:MAG: hypothetical protein V9E87_00255 [Gemmatimonadales bacterium]
MQRATPDDWRRCSFPSTAHASRLGRRLGATGPHPTPRPKITGAKVLTADQLKDTPHLIPLFDSVRERPEIMDGIRCNCGCAGQPGFYSLLSCYEGDAHGAALPDLPGCRGGSRRGLHKEGKTLAEIRVAVDAQFGG